MTTPKPTRLLPRLRSVALACCACLVPASLPAQNYIRLINYQSQAAGPYTLADLTTDWPNCSLTNLNGLAPSESGGGRVNIRDYSGSKVLQVTYPAGGAGLNSGSGFSFHASLGLREEYYLEYRVKFETNAGGTFDWVKGGKLPGLGGGTVPSGGYYSPHGVTTRYMWRHNGRLVMYLYWNQQPSRTAAAGSQYGYDIDMGTTFIPGGSYMLRQRVKLNTPGVANGVIEVWVNGVLKYSASNYLFREAGQTWTLNTCLFQSFHGGNDPTWAPGRTNTAIFDDLRIWYP